MFSQPLQKSDCKMLRLGIKYSRICQRKSKWKRGCGSFETKEWGKGSKRKLRGTSLDRAKQSRRQEGSEELSNDPN